jgi:hypothetical protein
MSEEKYVEIVRYLGRVVENRIGPLSEGAAKKVQAGVDINLNHEAYFTRIAKKRKCEEAK